MRPSLVVIEGLDGTGKSTLAARLAARMGATLLRTPPAELGEVRPVVDDAFARSPIAAQLFYGASVVHASDRARALLAAGTPVVIDRYWLSTVAYAQCRDAHVDLSAVEPVLLCADLTVFLEVDESARRERLQTRGMTDADRDSVRQRDALRTHYLRALDGSRVSGAVLRLDTSHITPDELVERVLAEVA